MERSGAAMVLIALMFWDFSTAGLGAEVVTAGLLVSKKLNGLKALNELNDGTNENADCC